MVSGVCSSKLATKCAFSVAIGLGRSDKRSIEATIMRLRPPPSVASIRRALPWTQAMTICTRSHPQTPQAYYSESPLLFGVLDHSPTTIDCFLVSSAHAPCRLAEIRIWRKAMQCNAKRGHDVMQYYSHTVPIIGVDNWRQIVA